MSEFKFPSEEVDLPSQGLLYPEDSPLSSGKVEIKYMTAKEEDILTNQSYIQKGIVLDKLLESVIIDKKINLKDLIIGDKNALLVATRILGYGKDYKFTYKGEPQTIDLTKLNNRPLNTKDFSYEGNSFDFDLPHMGTPLTFKIINGHDEEKIQNEINGLKKITPNASPELTTRLKHVITSVGGKTDTKDIRDFVDNYFLARDSRAFREHIKEIHPDIDMTYILDGGEEVEVPIGLSFFWPDF